MMAFYPIIGPLKLKRYGRTDGRTDGQTDRQTLIKRCEDASKKLLGKSLTAPTWIKSGIEGWSNNRVRTLNSFWQKEPKIRWASALKSCSGPYRWQKFKVGDENVLGSGGAMAIC